MNFKPNLRSKAVSKKYLQKSQYENFANNTSIYERNKVLKKK